MQQTNYRLFVSLEKLESEIRNEQHSRAPDVWWLLRLKKLRLATKDRIHLLVNGGRQGAA